MKYAPGPFCEQRLCVSELVVCDERFVYRVPKDDCLSCEAQAISSGFTLIELLVSLVYHVRLLTKHQSKR